jgi:multidrug efflux pump subunit AcrA (membrane-fusion protein)
VTVEGDTRVHSGRITRVSPAILEENRMLRVEADVPSGDTLRPGQFASAEIVIDEREDGLSVPASALVTFAGLEKVVVVEEGKALEKSVATGRRGADWVEIVSGLAPGETVVLEPTGVRTGQPLDIVEEAARADADAR